MLENLLRTFSAYQLYSLKENENEHVIFFNGMHYSVPEKETMLKMIDLLKNSIKDYDYIKNRTHELNSLSDEVFTNQRIKKEIKVKSGFVYLAYCFNTKLHKIGSTKNVSDRIKYLKTANPMIELVFSSKVKNVLTEKEIHKLYDRKRVSGEWFKLSKYDVNNIVKFLKKNNNDTN